MLALSCSLLYVYYLTTYVHAIILEICRHIGPFKNCKHEKQCEVPAAHVSFPLFKKHLVFICPDVEGKRLWAALHISADTPAVWASVLTTCQEHLLYMNEKKHGCLCSFVGSSLHIHFSRQIKAAEDTSVQGQAHTHRLNWCLLATQQ